MCGPCVRAGVGAGVRAGVRAGEAAFDPLNLNPLVYYDAKRGSLLATGGGEAGFGVDVAALDDLTGEGINAVQGTANNQPVARTLIGGEGYLYNPGVTGASATVPDEAALDVTGDITLEVLILPDDFSPASDQVLLAKYDSGTNRSYQFTLKSTGHLAFAMSRTGNVDGGNDCVSSEIVPTSGEIWVRAKRSGTSVDFETSEDGSNWTALGTTQSLSHGGTIHSGSADVTIGANSAGAPFLGGIKRARIFASVDGTDERLNVDFTKVSDSHGAETITAETGQTVTINGDARLVRYPFAEFDGDDDSMLLTLAEELDAGWLMVVATLLGGESGGRVVTCHSLGGGDFDSDAFPASLQNGTSGDLVSFSRGVNAQVNIFEDGFDGRVIHAVGFGDGAGALTASRNGVEAAGAAGYTIAAQEVRIGALDQLGVGASKIDLHAFVMFAAAPSAAAQAELLNYFETEYPAP